MIMDGVGGNNPFDPIGPTNSTYGGPANPAILFTDPAPPPLKAFYRLEEVP